MLRRTPAINMALLTEGAGMGWPKLQTSINRGVNENAALNENVALNSDTISVSPPIRLSTQRGNAG